MKILLYGFGTPSHIVKNKVDDVLGLFSEGTAPMQKEQSEPKLCNDRGRAYSWHKGKRHYFGKWGTREAKSAYKRFCAKLVLGEPVVPPANNKDSPHVQSSGYSPPKNADGGMPVVVLADEFLKYHTPRLHKTDLWHFKRVIGFLVEVHGGLSVDDFSPKKLRNVRDQIIRYGKISRKKINQYTTMLVRIFAWGVEEEWVDEKVAGALKFVKHLPEGEPGTFDHPEREDVPFIVIEATLKWCCPTIAAMIQTQYLLGLRPDELCRMTVGSINRTKAPDLWYYDLDYHKTRKHIGKKEIPLSKAVQALIAPFLIGKEHNQAVFSPIQAQAERNAEKRANRKVKKITPSRAARDAARAENPAKRIGEFYNPHSYRTAVLHAIRKGNKALPDEQKIPHWFPYLLRNSCATRIEEDFGLDESQAQLAHRTADMTRRYSRAQLRIRERVARKQQANPFADNSEESEGKR